SFTQSAIGPALLGFLVLVLAGSFTLFSFRAHLVSSSPRLESFVSREGTFLINNLLLAVYAFVVLIGTTYPLVLEAFTGTQVGVGEPFFNRLAVPLSFLLLLVMGFGPITPWGPTHPGLIWRRTRIPAVVALAAGLVTALTVTRIGWVALAVTLGTFVVATIAGLLVEQSTNRRSKLDLGPLTAMNQVIVGDQPFWAGQLSHVGVVLMAVGIAFAANLGDHLEVELTPGQSVEFAGHVFTYESPFLSQSSNKTTRGARLSVTRNGDLVGIIEPAANTFGNSNTAISTPDVLNRPGGDLYASLLDLDSASATLTLDTSPLIWLLWVGGLVAAGGGFWSMAARRRERVGAPDRQNADA
ncbi:MAG: cytochrome c-type biogenesis CcmF C-terminal domain-containing protein, partial [Acidimicrobiia bacterium]